MIVKAIAASDKIFVLKGNFQVTGTVPFRTTPPLRSHLRLLRDQLRPRWPRSAERALGTVDTVWFTVDTVWFTIATVEVTAVPAEGKLNRIELLHALCDEAQLTMRALL